MKELTFFIPNSTLNRFKKEVEKQNKKLLKYDSKLEVVYHDESSINVSLFEDEIFVVDVEEMDGKLFKVRGRNVTVAFPEVRGKQNVEFLGTIKGNKKSGYDVWVPGVFTSEEQSSNSLYKHAHLNDTNICDHCNINRRRNKYFYFIENNEIKKIGSTCVKEWFGLDLESIIYSFEKITEFESDESFGLGNNFNDFDISLDDLIKIVSFVTDGFYLSWQSEGVTTDLIKNNISKAKEIDDYFVNNKLVKDADFDIRKELVKTWNIEPTNDFEFNIYHSLFIDNELKNYIPFEKIGIVSYAIYASVVGYKRREVFVQTRGIAHCGEIGDKVTFTAKAERVASFDTRWGYSNIYLFEDGDYVFKWITSKDIDEEKILTMTGTIKNHEMYGSEKQTVVTRCKII